MACVRFVTVAACGTECYNAAVRFAYSNTGVSLSILPRQRFTMLQSGRIWPGAYPREGVHSVRDYELGIIVSPEASEEQTKTILDRVSQMVQSGGGQVVKVHPWGRRRLAYPIGRHRDGLYFFLDLSLTPQTVLEIGRSLRVTEAVIRHLIVKRDPKAVAAQRAREAQAAATPHPEAPAEVEAEAAEQVEEADLPDAEAFVEADEADETEDVAELDELDDAPEADEEAKGEA